MRIHVEIQSHQFLEAYFAEIITWTQTVEIFGKGYFQVPAVIIIKDGEKELLVLPLVKESFTIKITKIMEKTK